jgi:predicted metal-dependent hydrolase
MDVDQLAFGPPPVEVRRSARRRRTVSAYREGESIVVLLPARMTRAEERHWVEVMTERLVARERRSRPSDAELLRRARSVAERYLDARVEPASVRWVDNMGSRWGSCTAEDRTIRLSSRLRSMPAYVVDYVLLHELAHLVVPAHGPRFWALLEGYPRTERARGFLDGWSAAGSEGDAGRADAPDGGSVDGESVDESSGHASSVDAGGLQDEASA